MWVSEDASVPLPTSGSHEPDWTVIDPNQGSAGYHNHSTQPNSRPIRFEVDDLKCICLSSLSETNGKY